MEWIETIVTVKVKVKHQFPGDAKNIVAIRFCNVPVIEVIDIKEES